MTLRRVDVSPFCYFGWYMCDCGYAASYKDCLTHACPHGQGVEVKS